MDYVQVIMENFPVLGIVLLGLINMITSILTFRKTGKIVRPSSDPVEEDLQKLIDYHQKTADDLRAVRSSNINSKEVKK